MAYTWLPMNIEPGKTAGGGGKLIPNPTLKLPSPFHEVMRFKHLSERTETAFICHASAGPGLGPGNK